MNKHIELVKKWLKDKDAVSLEELEANKEGANTSYAAYKAAYYAAAKAAYGSANAAYWVNKYEKLTK